MEGFLTPPSENSSAKDRNRRQAERICEIRMVNPFSILLIGWPRRIWLAKLRPRTKFVRLKPSLLNKIHALAVSNGRKLRKESLSSERGLARVMEQEWTPGERTELQIITEQIDSLKQSIKRMGMAIGEESRKLRGFYTSAFELMIASILAAQNRDTTINKITPNLFRRYPTPADYMAAPVEELEQDIRKAKQPIAYDLRWLKDLSISPYLPAFRLFFLRTVGIIHVDIADRFVFENEAPGSLFQTLESALPYVLSDLWRRKCG